MAHSPEFAVEQNDLRCLTKKTCKFSAHSFFTEGQHRREDKKCGDLNTRLQYRLKQFQDREIEGWKGYHNWEVDQENNRELQLLLKKQQERIQTINVDIRNNLAGKVIKMTVPKKKTK